MDYKNQMFLQFFPFGNNSRASLTRMLGKTSATTMRAHFGVFFGSLTNLTDVFYMSHFFKLLGTTDFQYENYKLSLNIDAPFFYSLNRQISSFENIDALCVIGSNLRFEASLLNTLIRKVQSKRSVEVSMIGAATNMGLKQNHIGNGIRSLVNLLENRSKLSTKLIALKNASVILGVGSLKNNGSFYLQNLVRLLGKKLYLNTTKNTRFSLLHDSVGSLSTAYLGVQPGVRSSLHVAKQKDKGFNNLFLVQPNDFTPSK
jgi:NADH-quinone oxidoreductase subunit G